MFAIVTFPEENDAPAIVSTNWINRTRNTCYYPNVKTELQKNKFLIGREEPKPDWTECPIKLLREFASYVTAKDHLSEAEMTSNLESEAEGNTYIKKRPRKERIIVLPGEEWTSSDDGDVGQPGKKSSKPKMSPFPPPPSPSHVSPKTSLFRSPAPTPRTPLSPVITTSQPLAIDIPIQSSSSSGCSISSNSSEVLQLKGNQELMWKVLGELSTTSERLENKLDKILSILEQPSQPREAPESPCEEQLLASLPVKVEEVGAFEEKLKEPAVKQRLIKYLLAVGGKDVKIMAANLMRRLFLDEMGEQYSLTGKAGKDGPGKKPFIKTESFRLVYDVCLRKFRHAEEGQIREAVSDWLMQAKFRKLRRESRRAKSVGGGDANNTAPAAQHE